MQILTPEELRVWLVGCCTRQWRIIAIYILLYMCPHTAIYVSAYCYICVLILLYMCPHTAICVLILLYMCPHTPIYVSGGWLLHETNAYCYICVLILLYMCPHTAICVLILLYVSGGWLLHETNAYSQPTKTENLDPGKGEWLCIGAREVGKNVLLLAAMAKRQDVLRRTSTSSEVNQANGAYWYCCPGKSFGFSRNPRIDLKSADTEDTDGEYRLSWHLDSDSGGWRAGMKKNLVREAGTHYEKVVFYLKPSKTLSVEPSERFFIGRQVAFAETSSAESSNGAQFPCFTGTKVQKCKY